MKIVSVEELITQKILIFDLFNENGEKIMSAGEFLTPGKLLQLHHIKVLYREDNDDSSKINESSNVKDQSTFDNILKYDSITDSFNSQDSYKDISDLFAAALREKISGDSDKVASLCFEARDKIVEQVLPIVNDIVYKSDLKIQGDYNYAHGLNVSLLSTVLATKLGFDEAMVRDIALGAMLCDIGKSRIPPEILEKNVLSGKENKIMQMHTVIGYKILKEEMKLPEHIAKIALEHHERNDGSGYPYGISGELISPAAQIVIVCDVYDDLTSKRGPVAVKNSKEAVKVMMELGSRWFSPNVLYKFVYMSNFNDLSPT